MFLLIQKRYNILISCHRNHIYMETSNFCEKWHFQRFLTKSSVCPDVWFWRFGCLNGNAHADTLLAKTRILELAVQISSSKIVKKILVYYLKNVQNWEFFFKVFACPERIFLGNCQSKRQTGRVLAKNLLCVQPQGLSQNLETGCPKLAIVKFWGIQIFKRDHNMLRFQP